MKKVFFLLVLYSSMHVHAQWNTQPELFPPDPRDGAFSFVINHTAYAGAGIVSKDFWKYDASTHAWTQLNDAAGGIQRAFSISFVSGGYGYVVGGDSAFGKTMKDMWKYDPVTDTWMQMTDFPGGNREGMAVWNVNDRIFVAGGLDLFDGSGYGTIYKDCYEYLPATDTWNQLQDLPVQVGFPSYFSIGSKLYFVNGSTSNTTYNNDLYEMDIQTMTWQKRAAFPGSPRDAGIGFSSGSYGYAGLGQNAFSNTNKDFYQYNPASNSWLQLGDYPSEESGWVCSFQLDNKVYVGSGLAFPSFTFSGEFYSYTFLSTGIQEESKWRPSLTIYPIPAQDILYIQTDQPIDNYQLTDLTGKIIATSRGKVSEISLEGITPGIYFLHVYTKDQVWMQKTIVSR